MSLTRRMKSGLSWRIFRLSCSLLKAPRVAVWLGGHLGQQLGRTRHDNPCSSELSVWRW